MVNIKVFRGFDILLMVVLVLMIWVWSVGVWLILSRGLILLM